MTLRQRPMSAKCTSKSKGSQNWCRFDSCGQSVILKTVWVKHGAGRQVLESLRKTAWVTEAWQQAGLTASKKNTGSSERFFIYGLTHLLIVFVFRHSNKRSASSVRQTVRSVFLHGPGGGAHVTYRKNPSRGDQNDLSAQGKLVIVVILMQR